MVGTHRTSQRSLIDHLKTFYTCPSNMRQISTRVRRRLGIRMREAFTFLVATAWAELFHELFLVIGGDDTHVLMRFAHAIMFTVLAVLITLVFDMEDDEKDSEG